MRTNTRDQLFTFMGIIALSAIAINLPARHEPDPIASLGDVGSDRITCDGEDTDCGAEVDALMSLPNDGFDFVFIMDRSGSMQPYLDAVRKETESMAAKYVFEHRPLFVIDVNAL